jgi:hypothetical protein
LVIVAAVAGGAISSVTSDQELEALKLIVPDVTVPAVAAAVVLKMNAPRTFVLADPPDVASCVFVMLAGIAVIVAVPRVAKTSATIAPSRVVVLLNDLLDPVPDAATA